MHGGVAHQADFGYLTDVDLALLIQIFQCALNGPHQQFVQFQCFRFTLLRVCQPRHDVFPIYDLRVGQAFDSQLPAAFKVEQVTGQLGTAHIHRQPGQGGYQIGSDMLQVIAAQDQVGPPTVSAQCLRKLLHGCQIGGKALAGAFLKAFKIGL